ncbi:hypothetical protein BTVI_48508 [Pitangus sulphuratus]|nr:hypothetical protein BTVI_48508 [Pitangus sulphuratus]
MRAAAGSVPAARPELGPKSSRALRCLFQAAPISTASTLSIGDRGEEEEAEEEELKEALEIGATLLQMMVLRVHEVQ